MLTHLRIKNFKAWRDTGDIRLAPLTVFFGTNSSGKSSINQFLLMLKQTAQSADRKRVLHPGDRDSIVDLGTYEDMVYGHDVNELIDFKFGWNLSQKMRVEDAISGKKFSGDRIKFEGKVGLLGAKRQDIAVQEMQYELGDLSEDGLLVEMKRKEPSKNKYELSSSPYKLKRKPGRPWLLPPPIRFYGFPDEVSAHYQNADFVGDLALALERCLRRIYYLGPLRKPPERSYSWSGEMPEHVGWEGERAVYTILAAASRSINARKYEKYRDFKTLIASWLQQMGLIASFEVHRVAEGKRDYEVLIKTKGSEQKVNLMDVGFGISQVLPVLVQCFYAPPGSIIIMEQPELHLHPSVQASLADLFIETIQSRENGKDRNIQLLIESHSEHFLRRLQRRVAEEMITRDEVAIYFCRPTPSGAKMEPLPVDMFGNISNWPDDFFGDQFDDIARMTERGIERRIEARSK